MTLAAWPAAPTKSAGVESVPAPLLTLLLELGIHPSELDVDELHRCRWMTWAEPTVTEHPTHAGAHIERTALLAALWRRIEACPAIDIVPLDRPGGGRRDTASTAIVQVRARQLVDARGRAAASRRGHLRPPRPWLATSCTIPRGGIQGDVRLAAASDGYGYRLGSARHLTIGWVAPGRPARTPDELHAALSGVDTHWLIEGVQLSGPLTTRIASLVVSTESPSTTGADVYVGPFVTDIEPITIGDAALRRDALASQGLSIGLSDARLAARTDWTQADSVHRTKDSTGRHIASLVDVLATCRHGDRPAWRDYADWVASLPLERAQRSNGEQSSGTMQD